MLYTTLFLSLQKQKYSSAGLYIYTL
ncbi:MAG: hypothetical protein EZS28_054715, partial [Streblomastix strix]